MRAAFFTGATTMDVREVEDRELGPEEARVRVHYCGICGSDLSLFKYGILSGDDRVLGHEWSGVVEEDAAGHDERGTRVVGFPARGCGECLWCTEGHPRYCLSPPTFLGAYAERISVLSRDLIPIPDQVDDRAGSLAEPLGVAIRAVTEADPKAGDLAYVSGLGSIGLLGVSALVDRGVRVVGGDVKPDRRELGEELGCEMTFDPTAEDPFWKLLGIDRHGPRFAFECSGNPFAVQLAFNTCGHMGTVVLLGIPFEPTPFIPAVMAVKEQRALSIAGPSRKSMEEALRMLTRRPQAAKVITGQVPLERIQETMVDLVEGRGGVKVLVDPRS